MMIKRSTTLNAAIAQVWDLVQHPKTLEFVAAPLLRFQPLEPSSWPDCWRPGPHLVRMLLFGVIPMGTQCINIAFPAAHAMLDAGSGQVVRVWDHLITLEARHDGRTQYTDSVEIHAGILTLPIWVFSLVFYRHRQQRWHELLRLETAPWFTLQPRPSDSRNPDD